MLMSVYLLSSGQASCRVAVLDWCKRSRLVEYHRVEADIVKGPSTSIVMKRHVQRESRELDCGRICRQGSSNEGKKHKNVVKESHGRHRSVPST